MVMTIHEADGVFQGGGVKGPALVGALLEFVDKRNYPDIYVEHWANVAGTRAGAIIATYLACGHDAKETHALQDAPYKSFKDWGPGGKIMGGGLNLLRYHGLAAGQSFATGSMGKSRVRPSAISYERAECLNSSLPISPAVRCLCSRMRSRATGQRALNNPLIRTGSPSLMRYV